VYFDTGLDSASFARAKIFQNLKDDGFIVNPDGSYETWKAGGVIEVNGSMIIQGPSFTGERLDLLVSKVDFSLPEEKRLASQQEALQAVTSWIRAKMFLDGKASSIDPGAAFISNLNAPDNIQVLLAPVNLSNLCLAAERSKTQETRDHYSYPELTGMNAVAFYAGTMLYRIFTGVEPYLSGAAFSQDIKEGVFLPPHLACPGLNRNLCAVIQSMLRLPAEKKNKNGPDNIAGLLSLLTDSENHIVSVSSLFSQISAEESAQIENEKKQFFSGKNKIVKTKRFILKHKALLIITGIVIVFVLFFTADIINSIKQRPTTAGMSSDNVIITYYEAFSAFDHLLMDACVQGADKTDIKAAINLFAFNKVREAYEYSAASVITAQEWLEKGGELPAPNVFGVTDMSIDRLSGNEDSSQITYRVNYVLWYLEEYSVTRSDILVLKRDKKNNWRITEIQRTENKN
jgi:hypothetical protein